MECPKCKARINKTSNFCSKCGFKLVEAEEEKKLEKEPEVVVIKEEKVEQDYRGELIDIYIGSGKESIKQGNFSAPAFFLGPLYYYYRKLNVEATILLLIQLAVFIFLGYRMLVCNIILSIYAGFTFKKHYLAHVKESVSNIINLNVSGKKENAMLMAYNKGGTTTAPIVIISSLYFLSIIGLAIYMIATSDFELEYEQDEYVPEVEELYYDIPDKFYKDVKKSNENYHIYYTTDKKCSFYITEKFINGYNPYSNGNNKGSVEHLSNSKLIREQDEILINGYKWKYEEEITEHSFFYGLYYTGDYVEYIVSFFHTNDDTHEYCIDSFDELKDSLELTK